MSSPAAAPDKETLKLLLPLRYDGKTVIECDRFLLQLRIYWMVNMSLTTIELKVQVALSLLDGDARAWATVTGSSPQKGKIKKRLDAVPTHDITPPSTAHDLMRGALAHLPPRAAACFKLPDRCYRPHCRSCRDLRSSDWGKPNSWGRPTDSYRSDGELCSNLRLGTRNVLVSKGNTEVAGSSPRKGKN
ncbi:hypothetical protein POSPLADRAFT_1154166 [Postia placenta MAD-698-R-SB12]|uniref:Uncharacterized protein n=1 Tax=Postia placenta MAD-698-R-SB12 TaxID=670580 RepID=A0A1X6MP70_9APHY|nr:hypothetical protein POSPLADRAFT_1154166 [Postia placenta MAD-698-R-SB12]OSX58175.1 hypothetical protein POSPLADRAFT_1154166 [Postia placenta MAD-698-R-SB12]